jgi:hypothetical protein
MMPVISANDQPSRESGVIFASPLRGHLLYCPSLAASRVIRQMHLPACDCYRRRIMRAAVSRFGELETCFAYCASTYASALKDFASMADGIAESNVSA